MDDTQKALFIELAQGVDLVKVFAKLLEKDSEFVLHILQEVAVTKKVERWLERAAIFIKEGKTVLAIKEFRKATGLDLKDSKYAMEHLRNHLNRGGELTTWKSPIE